MWALRVDLCAASYFRAEERRQIRTVSVRVRLEHGHEKFRAVVILGWAVRKRASPHTVRSSRALLGAIAGSATFAPELGTARAGYTSARAGRLVR